MSLTYKFDKRGDGNPEKKNENQEQDAGKDIELYELPGSVRTIAFVETSGQETVLNYSELRKMQFLPSENTIILTFFGGEDVTLKGVNLQRLFEDFETHIPKKITCVDERYAATKSENDCYATAINISTPKE